MVYCDDWLCHLGARICRSWNFRIYFYMNLTVMKVFSEFTKFRKSAFKMNVQNLLELVRIAQMLYFWQYLCVCGGGGCRFSECIIVSANLFIAQFTEFLNTWQDCWSIGPRNTYSREKAKMMFTCKNMRGKSDASDLELYSSSCLKSVKSIFLFQQVHTAVVIATCIKPTRWRLLVEKCYFSLYFGACRHIIEPRTQ